MAGRERERAREREREGEREKDRSKSNEENESKGERDPARVFGSLCTHVNFSSSLLGYIYAS